VLDIDAEQIEAAPALGASSYGRFILGMAKTEAAVKMLLEIDRLVAVDEVSQLEAV